MDETMEQTQTLDTLNDIAAAMDSARQLYETKAGELDDQIEECFHAGCDLELIARMGNISMLTVETRHRMWKTLQPVPAA